jgi:lysophospholipase L1-like esterase
MVAMLALSNYQLTDDSPATASTAANSLQEKRPTGKRQSIKNTAIRPGLAGEDVLLLARQDQWTYQQWVEQLRREAIAAANNRPPRLTVLAGDSLTLWFPVQLLPEERSWLNQGISGETSSGLLRRLYVFENTRPETIFVMIGINDLVRGYDDETILDNQRQIIRELRRSHPTSQIVVQSILPHSGNKATWENSDRLLDIPNSRIRRLNLRLKAIADFEGAFFLDLHPLFATPTGFLQPEFSTDGLHLNERGYLVWRTAIKLYSQIKLEEPE